MKKGNAKKIIVISVINLVLSIGSFVTGTMAWFRMNQTAQATAGQFSVVATPGVKFDLYYLQEFRTDVSDPETKTRDGNLNSAIVEFSGYESDSGNAHFEKVNDYVPTSTESPASINHLWPAHKLTFALVLTSGSASSFMLEEWEGGVSTDLETVSWDDENDEYIKTDKAVSLLWAIDIKGACYKANSPDAGYSAYASDLSDIDDVFTFSEDGAEDPDPESSIIVIDEDNPTGSGSNTIFYFTIEFSDDDSTFYSPADYTDEEEEEGEPSEPKSYYQKDTSGDSNCYENLALTRLTFVLK